MPAAFQLARNLKKAPKAIAAELSISHTTAARHVANIMAKLGFNSRSQIAAWVADRAQGPGRAGDPGERREGKGSLGEELRAEARQRP